MDEAQRKIQREVENVVQELDKGYLRKIQGNMHRCAAKCCDNTSLSMEAVQSCMSRCSVHLESSQSLIEAELKSFQDRLTRCSMACQDSIKDKDPKPSEMQHYQGQFENCLLKCADDHIALLPSIKKKLKSNLDRMTAEPS